MKNYNQYKNNDVSWVIGEHLKFAFYSNRDRYYSRRLYSREGAGTLDLVTTSDGVFEMKHTKKRVAPKKGIYKNKRNIEIIEVISVYFKDIFDEVYQTEKGLFVKDRDIGNYEITVVKKNKEPI